MVGKIDYAKFQSLADRLVENSDTSESKASIYTPEINSGSNTFDNNGNIIPGIIPRVDIFGSATPVFNYKQDEIDGDIVRATDGYIFFSPDDKTETIEIGMFYNANGKKYRVQDLSGITSNDGIKVYQKVQLRS